MTSNGTGKIWLGTALQCSHKMFPSSSPKLDGEDAAKLGNKLDFGKMLLPMSLWVAEKGDHYGKKRLISWGWSHQVSSAPVRCRTGYATLIYLGR